ncbi:MAG: CAP domain-containing protein, partial [Solirubrobacterales bacterium]
MRSQGFFSHEAPNGAGFVDRIRQSGYLARASAWSVGENIGWGASDLGTHHSLIGAWMSSKSHRANILDR